MLSLQKFQMLVRNKKLLKITNIRSLYSQRFFPNENYVYSLKKLAEKKFEPMNGYEIILALIHLSFVNVKLFRDRFSPIYVCFIYF